MGASTPIIELLATFLSNRTMSVRVGESWSHPRSVHGGVPQGSILGVFLFNVTTDDLEDGTAAAPLEERTRGSFPLPRTWGSLEERRKSLGRRHLERRSGVTTLYLSSTVQLPQPHLRIFVDHILPGDSLQYLDVQPRYCALPGEDPGGNALPGGASPTHQRRMWSYHQKAVRGT